jgi:hypothetical protein
MSVPLDRLYNYLRDVCNHDIIIYRFFPHGSKKLVDCTPLSDDYTSEQKLEFVHGIFHDQEPLSFDTFMPTPNTWRLENVIYCKDPVIPYSWWKTRTLAPHMKYDHVLLVHSEKNSVDVAKFEENGVCSAYWWNHAAVALDWYRYAQHDPQLLFDPRLVSKDFLIYNRAWAGTREYRLKFAELIVENNLLDSCHMRFSATDEGHPYKGHHYTTHKFKNSAFEISTCLEEHFDENVASSDSSADYDSKDYNACGIEVVLETLFDDTRLHLTEKSLRPIACGKPFILAATTGSLEYLRSYGFKTFGGIWDESYDQITDPATRLQAIVELMKTISSTTPHKKSQLLAKCREICNYNQRRFFSKEFFNSVISEYITNVGTAVEKIKQNQSGVYFDQWNRAT